jgi:hypothetical protein
MHETQTERATAIHGPTLDAVHPMVMVAALVTDTVPALVMIPPFNCLRAFARWFAWHPPLGGPASFRVVDIQIALRRPRDGTRR